jgi:hypothetical protein
MFKKLSIILGVFMALSGCSGNNLDYYKNTKPEIDIKKYFSGPIKGWGVVQDWRGRVVTQFDVEMVGTWKGDEGTLNEKFVYYDGKKQERTWKIKKLEDGNYIGTAGDILGEAKGHQSGNAMNWSYSMDLEVSGGTYRIKFDDWMWQMNDGVVLNRSYLKKFGITVAELTLFMKKEGK